MMTTPGTGRDRAQILAAKKSRQAGRMAEAASAGIKVLLVKVLVLGVVVTGSLSLFLLNRTLIQSVDNNLQSSVSEMLSLAQHELAGDDDAITSSTYIPVEYAVEVRDEQGRPIEQEVFHYGTGKVSVQFPDLTDEQILQRGVGGFTGQTQ